MEMLWNQAEGKVFSRTQKGLKLGLDKAKLESGELFDMPDLGKLSTRENLIEGDGFSLELSIKTGQIGKEQVILDTRRKETTGYGIDSKFKGNGIVVKIHALGGVKILLDDGRSPLIWETGKDTIRKYTDHHIVINVDAASKVLTFVIDGDLWDGGSRPFGYARFNPYLYDINGEKQVAFSEDFDGVINDFKIYGRPLYTSEAINNYRA